MGIIWIVEDEIASAGGGGPHTHSEYALTAHGHAYAASAHSHLDADLPAGIARDTEVTAAIASHEATASHGVGSEPPYYAPCFIQKL